jgi:hypothetical protein
MSEFKVYSLEATGCYPVTILKYLLNLKKIESMIQKATDNILKMESIPVSSDGCEECKNSNVGVCRPHTCIDRILDEKATAVIDSVNGVYMIKNEIFKPIGDDKLLVFYCPHTKLCTVYNDKNIRKIDAYLFDGAKDILPEYSDVQQINILELASNSVKIWFNPDFTITTQPQADRRVGYYLQPNK